MPTSRPMRRPTTFRGKSSKPSFILPKREKIVPARFKKILNPNYGLNAVMKSKNLNNLKINGETFETRVAIIVVEVKINF